MDAIFVPLAAVAGASVDQVKLILCLLTAYPLGSVFIRIPSSSPNLKHTFNICVTLFYLLPVLQLYNGFLQLLGDILVTYFIARNVRTKQMPWIIFTLIFGHLTANHIIRAIYGLSYETVEITGPQMVLTMKLTTFAWNVWDARRPSEELDKWQLAHRVEKFPGLLEFLGYAFYFPGFLVGPYLVYTDYIALIDESLFRPAAGSGKTKPGLAVPTGRKRVAYRKMIMGLMYLGLYVFFGSKFNYAIALHPWFAAKSLPYRIILFQVCGFFERCKYYTVWTLTEGASILTGLGFTGFDASGASTWEGAANVLVGSIEFAPNFKVLLDSWNMKTNVWLRECVYKRITPKGKKPGFRSSMVTFLTSALWHGVAGGYYLTFLLGGFITTAARLARTNLRPLLLPLNPPSSTSTPASVVLPPPTPLKRLYDIGGVLLSILIVNFATIPFILGNIPDSLRAWSCLGWYGIVVVGGALLFFYTGGAKWAQGVQRRREAKAGIIREPRGLKQAQAGAAYDKASLKTPSEAVPLPGGSGTATPMTESFVAPPSFDQIIPPQN